MNCYDHLRERHAFFGQQQPLPDNVDDPSANSNDNDDNKPLITEKEQYLQFQIKVSSLFVSELGECKDKESCFFVERHCRDIEKNKSSDLKKENTVTLDIVSSLHTFLFHTVGSQLYRLVDNSSILSDKSVAQMDDGVTDKQRVQNEDDYYDQNDVHNNQSNSHTSNTALELQLERTGGSSRFSSQVDISGMKKPKMNAVQSSIKSLTPDDDEKDDHKGNILVVDHDKDDTRVGKKKILSINFGERLDDWFSPLERPIFNNMYEEVTQNQFETIFPDVYEEIRRKCSHILESAQNEDQYFSLDQLIAIKLYTDCDGLQSTFRRTFWHGADLQQRKSFFHWAMMLQGAIVYGALPIMVEVYHGLSNLFTVKKLMPVFNGPISTTTSSIVATKFADSKGMLWRIQPRLWSEFENPIGIKVHWISRFEYEKEVLLMNCPLPIRKTKAFETGIHKKIEYLLNYLRKYREPITDITKFYQQIGLDKLVDDLEKLWLCDLGKTVNLFRYSTKEVDMDNINQWLSDDQGFSVTKIVGKIYRNGKRAIRAKMEICKSKFTSDDTSPMISDEEKMCEEAKHKKLQTKLEHYTLNDNEARQFLSVIRWVPVKDIQEIDPLIEFVKNKEQNDLIPHFRKELKGILEKPGKKEQKMKIGLYFSVFYRLVFDLKMYYLPFAAFTRVEYNGPSLDREKKFDINNQLCGDDPKLRQKAIRNHIREKHQSQSNLFRNGRYAKICHLKAGIPILQEMVYRHKVAYRLQFRFRNDKQTNIDDDVLDCKELENYVINDLVLDGQKFNGRIKDDLFEMQRCAQQMAWVAKWNCSEMLQVLNGLKQDSNAITNETNVSQMYELIKEGIDKRITMRKTKKKDQWKFIEIQVTDIIKDATFMNILNNNDFDPCNEENVFSFKLLCCIEDIDKEKWICIDKGKYDIDLDCVIDGSTGKCDPFKIQKFGQIQALSKKNGFDSNVWVFRSLRLTNGAELTVEPFGYGLINEIIKKQNNSEYKANDDDNDHEITHFGCVRIWCYESIIIDEGCTLTVNSKGMFGADNTKHLNLGRGESDVLKIKKNKKSSKNKPERAHTYYGGGGYGTVGKSARTFDGEVITHGGETYGDSALDELHFGSSGGKGIIESNMKSHYFSSDRSGGIIELTAQKIVNNGRISSNGKMGLQSNAGWSAGSGGSIKIKCNEFENNGIIEALGGKTKRKQNLAHHGDGGYGRIALYFNKSKDDDHGDVTPKPFIANVERCKKSIIPFQQFRM